jgi:predicted HAD superfamily Cof-like phosphohydrolase
MIEAIENFAEMEARLARADLLRREWEKLSRVSSARAHDVAASAYGPKSMQREAIKRYRDAYKAADLVYAQMMAEMGDQTFLKEIEADRLAEEQAATKTREIANLRPEWGIFAPFVWRSRN